MKKRISVLMLMIILIATTSCVLFQDRQNPTVSLSVSYIVDIPNVKVAVTVQFSDNDIVDRIELYDGANLVESRTVRKKSGTVVFYLPDVPVQEGNIKNFEFTAKAYDKSGNVTQSGKGELTLDFNQPKVTIKNDYVGNYVEVEVQKGPKLNKIEVFSNNEKVGEKGTEISEGIERVPVSITDDSTEILVKAVSEFGIVGQTSKNIIVDKIPPQAMILTNITGPYVSGTVNINIEATDQVGISKVEYYLDSTKLGEKTSAPYSYSIDTTRYSDGRYTFKVIAYDLAGNTAEANMQLVFENNQPGVEFILPKDGAYLSGNANIEVSASDGNGIQKVELYLNTTKINEMTASPYRYTLNTKNYPDGQYTLRAVAYDTFGKSKEKSIQIRIDNTFPTVNITKPMNGEVVVGFVNVEVNASDNNKVDKVELYLGFIKVGEKKEHPYTFVVDTRYYSGSYTLRAIAYDLANNEAEKSISLNIRRPVEGDIVWKFKSNDSVVTCPAIDSYRNTIYFGSGDGYLYAVGLNNEFKWKFKTNARIQSSPAIDTDGTIYVGSDDGYLYAINPDGTPKWSISTGNIVKVSPAIDSSHVYVANISGKVMAIDKFSPSRIKWIFYATGNIYSSPAVDYWTVYIGSDDGYLYAIDKFSGSLKWKYKTNGAVRSSPAIGYDGTVYVGSDDGCLYAITSDGRLRWQFRSDDWIRSSPVIGSDGTVYIGSDDGYLYAIGRDGVVKWGFKTNSYVRSTPLLASWSTIYVASDDGYLYALDANGNKKWKSYIGGNPSSLTIDNDGIIYVGTSDGYLKGVYTLSSGLAWSDWPKFKKDLKNTGYK
ncbi:PQQ-binding-like beta-propeller repeat protein [Fervidobacterium gondwanense]|uniref:Ig-like domain-containing protein n=1 Tax=Fervidobacterium gondwanense TaxID=44754 RepID=UPI003C7797BE